MILYPAIDLRQGRCVRLRQGDPSAETVFAEDPVAMARHWAALGAEWLHVVNLDGAFAEHASPGALTSLHPDTIAALPINLRRLHAINQAVEIPVQFGGGMRGLQDIEMALKLGASRVVLGTVAVKEPLIVGEALTRFGRERIVVGIDARDGWVATHGWTETSGIDAVALAQEMAEAGVIRTVYTDISRDGMLSGVNVSSTVELGKRSGLKVIASGGLRDLADIKALMQHGDDIDGVISGQAIYAGTMDFSQALQLAAAA